MALPSFTLTATVKEVLGNVVSNVLVESVMSNGRLTFKPNVGPDTLVKWSNVLYRIKPVTGRFDVNGMLVNDSGGPLLLLAQDDGLNIRNLQWQVLIDILPSTVPPSANGRIKPWWFNAPAAGTVIALKDIAPTPSLPISGATTAPATGNDHFTYTQIMPAASWSIPNTLGRFPTTVTVWIGGEQVEADVATPNTSVIVVTFSSAQSGRVEVT